LGYRIVHRLTRLKAWNQHESITLVHRTDRSRRTDSVPARRPGR
jgi:hypothetical protein